MRTNESLGRPISRCEALAIARGVLEQAEKDREKFFDEFYFYMVENSENLDPKISKLVDEHFWELT